MVKIQEELNVSRTLQMVSENDNFNVEGTVIVDNGELNYINNIRVKTKEGREVFNGSYRGENISNANFYGDADIKNSVIMNEVEKFVKAVKEFDFTDDKNEEE